MTNLLVPSFIWQSPPEHHIFSVLGVPTANKLEKIVTGSHSGVLCIWNVSNDSTQVCKVNTSPDISKQVVKPSFLLTPPESSTVVGFATTTYEFKPAIISGMEQLEYSYDKQFMVMVLPL